MFRLLYHPQVVTLGYFKTRTIDNVFKYKISFT